MTAFNDTFGIIGLSSENVGIDRRIYTDRTDTNPQLPVSYNGGRVDVYLNGVKLMGNHSGQSNYDYTYQNTGSGSSITLDTDVALVATDTIECVGYVSNSSNTVTTYTPSVSAGNNTFTSISHTSSDLLNVFLNGVLLDPSDYTADASADTVAITSLASGDVVHIQVIGALDHSDFVPASGGTFSGNVHIADNSNGADSALHIEKTTPQLRLQINGNSGYNTIESGGTNELILGRSGSPQMRIDSSGNVLVGKTSSDATVEGFEARSNGLMVGTVDSGYPLQLRRLTSDGNIIQLRKDTTTVGNIGTNGGYTYIGTTDVNVRFHDGADAILPAQSGGASRDNAIDLGSSGARFKDLHLSGGISFEGHSVSGVSGASSTTSDNVLDDYEEGTWTPKLTGGTTTYTTQVGYYVKVGKLVFVVAQMHINQLNSATQLLMGGLPFNDNGYSATINVNRILDSNKTITNVVGGTSGSLIYFKGNTSASASYGNMSIFKNSTQIWLSGTYSAT